MVVCYMEKKYAFIYFLSLATNSLKDLETNLQTSSVSWLLNFLIIIELNKNKYKL